MINKEKAIIFDYGATLDTNGVHWYHIFKEQHLRFNSFLTDEQLREAYVYGERTIAGTNSLEEKHNFKDTLLIKVGFQYDYLLKQNILNENQTKHIEDISESCYLIAKKNTKEAIPILEHYSKEYALGLVSNFYGNLDEVLRDFQLKDYFDIIVESAKVGISKPDKRLLLYAFDKMGISPYNSIVVGDSYKKDIIPAKQIGCSTIWLKGKGWKDNPIATPFADDIITDIQQIRKIIK
jgi:HAD superfamily hydrolase (TIGR01549 family)